VLSSAKIAASLKEQCYVRSETKLNLAEETYPSPSISKMDLTGTFPKNFTYSSQDVYDHAEISICANDNSCESTYSYTDSKLLTSSKQGELTVTLQLCYNAACSEGKVAKFNNNFDKDKIDLIDRLHAIDNRVLILSQSRLQLEVSSTLTPYTLLRSLEEVFVNQPQRLALTNEQCDFTTQVSSQNNNIPVSNISHSITTTTSLTNTISKEQVSTTEDTATEDTSTTTQINTETTQSNIFKTAAQYLGIAGSVISFVVLAKNIYKTSELNKEMIRKLDMFKEIREVVERNNRELSAENFEPLKKDLNHIKVKYGDLFSKDMPQKLLEEVQSTEKNIENLNKKLEEIDANKKLEPVEKIKLMGPIHIEITGYHNSIEQAFPEIKKRELQIPKEYKSPIKGYGGGIGKFIVGEAVSAGFIIVGSVDFGLAEEDIITTAKKIDSEIIMLLTEKNYLLEKL
jgi:hypothetical protein